MVGALNESEMRMLENHFNFSKGFEEPLSIWVIGRPASGKTTISTSLHAVLKRAGYRVELLDGDVLRSVLDGYLGYSSDDRLTAFKKYVHINQLMQQRGIIPMTATICGFRLFREIVRDNLKNPRFIYLDCPFNVAAQRDQKGHYSKALAGQIKNFFDVDVPFEVPIQYDIKIDSARFKPSEIVRRIVEHFDQAGPLGNIFRGSPKYEVDKI